MLPINNMNAVILKRELILLAIQKYPLNGPTLFHPYVCSTGDPRCSQLLLSRDFVIGKGPQ